MLQSWIETSDLTNREPEISDYYRSGQTTWNVKIEEARDILEQEIRNRGKELKHLCTPLSLVDGTKSDKDYAERTRLVIITSAVTPTPTFTFQGTNDGVTYTEVPLYKNSATATKSIAATGTTVWTFRDTYDYYKITFTGTITSTQYIVERSFELPHINLALALVYKSLMDVPDGHFESKAEMYMDKFWDSLDRALYTYDADEDGKVDSDEMEIKRTVFRR